MKAQNGIWLLLMICLSSLSGMGGCVRSVPPASLSCREVLAGDIRQLPDRQLDELLENASPEEEGGCWQGLMAACLRQNRTVPQRHLAEALRVFNRQADAELFHLAARSYLTGLAMGEGIYRDEDRALLEAYTRLLIHQAASSTDRDLQDAQLLCRRLDPELYRRFFQQPATEKSAVSY